MNQPFFLLGGGGVCRNRTTVYLKIDLTCFVSFKEESLSIV